MLTGNDMIGRLQTFTFNTTIEANSVNITTLSVYSKGNNGYAEIEFFGESNPWDSAMINQKAMYSGTL